LHVPTTQAGYEALERWASGFGPIDRFGVEGTGSYGAELTRVLRRCGHRVIEVNRPDRSTRRRRGKSDAIDAEAAARAVLAGTATAIAKSGDGDAEAIRMLKLTRDSAVKARTQTINQIRAVLVTAPAPLREQFTALSTAKLIQRCLGFPAELSTSPTAGPAETAQYSLRMLAQRYRQLSREATELNNHLRRLTNRAAPALTALTGVGPNSAAAILTAAGDNPHRLHSEAAFAALCGASPIPASSGKTNRHRLNRGGNRQANAALHRVAVVRLRWHEPTQNYMTRRRAQGKTTTEILRCLKRYIAREIYRVLYPPTTNDQAQPTGHV
jgi:transposase